MPIRINRWLPASLRRLAIPVARPSLSARLVAELLEDRLAPNAAPVPQLSSLPGAPFTLYLDFDGTRHSANGSQRH